MGWTVAHIESLGIVEIKLDGVVTGDGLREATTAGIKLAMEQGLSRGLIDATDQVRTGSMVDLIELPGQYSDQGLSRATNIALVIPADENLHGVAEFYETVCVNRGWNVETFADREHAIAWLVATPES